MEDDLGRTRDGRNPYERVHEPCVRVFTPPGPGVHPSLSGHRILGVVSRFTVELRPAAHRHRGGTETPDRHGIWGRFRRWREVGEFRELGGALRGSQAVLGRWRADVAIGPLLPSPCSPLVSLVIALHNLTGGVCAHARCVNRHPKTARIASVRQARPRGGRRMAPPDSFRGRALTIGGGDVKALRRLGSPAAGGFSLGESRREACLA